MTTQAILTVLLSLLAVTLTIHRGGGERSMLLRRCAIALLIGALIRELASDTDHAVYELPKRLAILASTYYVTLLVLTFRAQSISRRTANRIRLGAFVAGGAYIALFPFMPTQGAEHLPYNQAHTSIPTLLYYLIYTITLGAATVVVGVGCLRAALHPEQPVAARISLGAIVIGTITSLGYVVVGAVALATITIPKSESIRDVLVLITLSAFLIGIGLGGLRSIVVAGREQLAVNNAVDTIEPLWRATTALRPDVVLSHQPSNRRERLVRLVVETHDALTLLRDEHRDRLAAIRERFDSDPRMTAALLVEIVDDGAVPPLTRRKAPVLADEALTSSVRALRDIRLACNERNLGWQPDPAT